MSVLALNMVPESWDDNEELEWETSVAAFSFSTPIAPPAPPAPPAAATAAPLAATAPPVKSEAKIQIKNTYTNYPYFLAGVEGSVQRDLFPRTELPLSQLKQSLTTQQGVFNFVQSVRNYIKPLFYVLKSTKYYNPITKTRIPPKTKSEPIDPNFQYISLEDQLKVYRLFGFQGHVGDKKNDEDNKRDELLEKLKNILYNTNTLIVFIELLLIRICVTVEQSDIRLAYEQLRKMSDYEQKSYRLSANWFHDASWKKLRYVYGANRCDNITGGDGGISREMESCILKAATYKK